MSIFRWSCSGCTVPTNLASASTHSSFGTISDTARYVSGECPVGVIADASEITGLPRDNFEIHEISKEEFEGLRSK
jgi:hypothetical protein